MMFPLYPLWGSAFSEKVIILNVSVDLLFRYIGLDSRKKGPDPRKMNWLII